MSAKYFYTLLDNHIQSLNYKFRDKFSIRQSLYDDIILVLRDGWGDSQFKFWVYKNFKLIKDRYNEWKENKNKFNQKEKTKKQEIEAIENKEASIKEKFDKKVLEVHKRNLNENASFDSLIRFWS